MQASARPHIRDDHPGFTPARRNQFVPQHVDLAALPLEGSLYFSTSGVLNGSLMPGLTLFSWA